MIGDGKQRFVAQSQPLTFHRRCYHLEGFACPHFVCEKRIPTIQDVSNGVFLMFAQRDFGIHAVEVNMFTVVFARAAAVEKFIVAIHQRMTTVGVFPYPILKRILDRLLFLLCQSGFLGV